MKSIGVSRIGISKGISDRNPSTVEGMVLTGRCCARRGWRSDAFGSRPAVARRVKGAGLAGQSPSLGPAPRLGGCREERRVRTVVIVLGLATALIHLSLNFPPTIRPPELLFTLNYQVTSHEAVIDNPYLC